MNCEKVILGGDLSLAIDLEKTSKISDITIFQLLKL